MNAKFHVPRSVKFPEAIDLAQSLLARMEAGKMSEEKIKMAIASLVSTEEGARGFFVTYLTDERSLADRPSPATIAALETSPEIVAELLVKNIAMSAAMAVSHRRNHNEKMAQDSERVCRRTANLIKEVNLASLPKKLQQLQESAATGEGSYQEFLQRWNYDRQQREVILQAIAEINY
ncbi:MAG: hypothetical protein SAL07_01675 [Oscillatoria sp. PMC 1051.18]|nr:hypothetical protein [Oscillatoria sp. PMC 1050.18]MEC5028594.1 hypothetical protein [Oscillatoria sp. PMC 1051.18]